eukprot:scaffold34604_cov164-Amphora_coffeaeformis.AAC.8
MAAFPPQNTLPHNILLQENTKINQQPKTFRSTMARGFILLLVAVHWKSISVLASEVESHGLLRSPSSGISKGMEMMGSHRNPRSHPERALKRKGKKKTGVVSESKKDKSKKKKSAVSESMKDKSKKRVKTKTKMTCQIPCETGSRGTLAICHFDALTGMFETQCHGQNVVKRLLKSNPRDTCGRCEDLLVDITQDLDDFEDPQAMLKGTDSAKIDVMVTGVLQLVEEDMRQLVTAESVATSLFTDPKYTSELYAVRRRAAAFFDMFPKHCVDATYFMMTQVLAIVLAAVGLASPQVVAQGVSKELVMKDTANPMISEIFALVETSWFQSSAIDAFRVGMIIFGRMVKFLGLKVIFKSAINSVVSPVSAFSEASILLALIAIAVTNGASLLSNIASLLESVDELNRRGRLWQDTCFVTTCDGEVECDDGDLCTSDRSICNESTDWEWNCLFTPTQCISGHSCDPSDGLCKPDDILVPCVAVIDEDSSFGSPGQATLWSDFRTKYPARPFCLLVPNPEGSVSVPQNFLDDGLTFVHYNVIRDGGEAAQALDWESMCGLNFYSSANVGWVGVFIDDSGSMKEAQVAASRDLFYKNIEAKGIQVKQVVNGNENWILPFLTTLVPEEEPKPPEGCESPVTLPGYVFWSGSDSVGSDTEDSPLPFSSIANLALICDGDSLCKGFNTNGWMKTFVEPLSNWTAFGTSPSICDGLYIKTPDKDKYFVNGVGLVPEEVKWIDWIVEFSIPNFKVSYNEAIQVISRAAVWSLKEGVLSIHDWLPSVKNPFHHNLCAPGQPSAQYQMNDPLGVCIYNGGNYPAWQVGIAGEQPKEYTLSKLEELAVKYYGSIERALSQTAKQLEYFEESDEYKAILGADGDLKKAWLIRSHLIGFELVSGKIVRECLPPKQQWCTKYESGSCDTCDKFTRDAAALYQSIDDMMILLQSLLGSNGQTPPIPPLPVTPEPPTPPQPPADKEFGERLVAIALAEQQRGVIEDNYENEDYGGRIKEYRNAVTGGSQGCSFYSKDRQPEPWCADFVSWVFKEAERELVGVESTESLPCTETTGFAYVPYLMNWLKATKQWYPPPYVPVKGDLVIFNWQGRGKGVVDHVGFVVSVNSDGSINTIEGNTDEYSEGTDEYGNSIDNFPEGVYKRTRYASTIEGYGHVLPFEAPPDPSPTQPTPPTSPPPVGALELVHGQLTITGESVVPYVYWPDTPASGVSLGIGYDLGSRSTISVVSDLTSAGMTSTQANIISEAAGLRGAAASDWVIANKERVGSISEKVVRELFAMTMPRYTQEAKTLAIDLIPSPGQEKLNARSRELMTDPVKPLYTYVMKDEQWSSLHSAMIEFITDLKFHGGFYAYDRIARVNELLISNEGDTLAQFLAVASLFGSPPPPVGGVSYMDSYAQRIGLSLGNTETFYGVPAHEIRGATERRNRIRLSYLIKVITALKAGSEVVFV